jgi:hypothetical protein
MNKNYLLDIIFSKKRASISWNFREEKIFEIEPKEYLQYAKLDLKEKTKKALLNSIMNSKRAIDCQIDSICFNLGNLNKRLNFPEKIVFLRKIGIISPNILKKINKIRNLMEHEYKIPNKSDVEDAVDIADLFLASTEKFIREIYNLSFDVSMNINLRKIEKGVLTTWEIILKYKKKEKDFIIEFGKNNFRITKKEKEYEKLFLKYVEVIKNTL